MTELEYMKEKNRILFEYTGKILVPKSQLVDVKIIEQLSCNDDSECCPYCQLYAFNKCEGCPMDKSGNKCSSDNEGSTYMKVYYKLKEQDLNIHQVPEIISLVDKFNEEFKNRVQTDIDMPFHYKQLVGNM